MHSIFEGSKWLSRRRCFRFQKIYCIYKKHECDFIAWMKSFFHYLKEAYTKKYYWESTFKTRGAWECFALLKRSVQHISNYVQFIGEWDIHKCSCGRWRSWSTSWRQGPSQQWWQLSDWMFDILLKPSVDYHPGKDFIKTLRIFMEVHIFSRITIMPHCRWPE